MHVSRQLPLSVVAAAVVVLNLADALFTLVYVQAGLADESNPFMETALAYSGLFLYHLSGVPALVSVAGS